MRRCRLYLRLWLTRCLRGSRLYPAPAASWKLLHCSFLTQPAARSALAHSSPGRLRPVCRGPPALPPHSCFLLAAQTTTAAASPRPFSGAALAPRTNAPSRRLERALLPTGWPQAAAGGGADGLCGRADRVAAEAESTDSRSIFHGSDDTPIIAVGNAAASEGGRSAPRSTHLVTRGVLLTPESAPRWIAPRGSRLRSSEPGCLASCRRHTGRWESSPPRISRSPPIRRGGIASASAPGAVL